LWPSPNPKNGDFMARYQRMSQTTQELEGLEAGMSIEEMQIGFGEVDSNRDGLIDCREFTDWWTSD
jgi:Ca2+-binding EF-hand superfamily protein